MVVSVLFFDGFVWCVIEILDGLMIVGKGCFCCDGLVVW